jgi:hypothetical protein
MEGGFADEVPAIAHPRMATRIIVIHRKKTTRSDSSMLERVIQERLCWQFSA